MVNAKTTLSLPVVQSTANTDRVLLVSQANNANAQTATITVGNFFLMPPQPDPANSSSLVIQAGSFFFSQNFVYFADSNNHTKRIALSNF
jgi:hypothetical protein